MATSAAQQELRSSERIAEAIVRPSNAYAKLIRARMLQESPRQIIEASAGGGQVNKGQTEGSLNRNIGFDVDIAKGVHRSPERQSRYDRAKKGGDLANGYLAEGIDVTSKDRVKKKEQDC